MKVRLRSDDLQRLKVDKPVVAPHHRPAVCLARLENVPGARVAAPRVAEEHEKEAHAGLGRKVVPLELEVVVREQVDGGRVPRQEDRIYQPRAMERDQKLRAGDDGELGVAVV